MSTQTALFTPKENSKLLFTTTPTPNLTGVGIIAYDQLFVNVGIGIGKYIHTVYNQVYSYSVNHIPDTFPTIRLCFLGILQHLGFTDPAAVVFIYDIF